ncbi:MAG: hypothetical protein WBA57_12655 [Elainellaceae cyanobacterium]
MVTTPLAVRFQQFFLAPVTKSRDTRVVFWFGLSLFVALIYSLIALQEPLNNAYVIHDDVRSHVFWMHRFFDPSLFPNDLITDYFQSVAPAGYVTLYRSMASLGIDPLIFNKILPLPLVLITVGYCFWLVMSLFPVPAAGFLASALFTETIWSVNDVSSGTPRAFLYPLLMAFLYYLARRSLIPSLGCIILQGLFYPQCLFISGGILLLRLIRWQEGKFCLSRDRSDYVFCGLGLGLVFLMLLPYALKISDYGPVATLPDARSLPTLQHTSRKDFFHPNLWNYWVCNERSALFPMEWCLEPFPPHGWLAIALVPMLWLSSRFPLGNHLSSRAAVLVQVIGASVGMFILAHALLFRLHLPNRYTKHSFRIVLIVAGAIAFTIALDALFRWAISRWQSRTSLAAGGGMTLWLALLLAYPWLIGGFINPDYVTAEPAAIFTFFSEQPKDIVVASLSEEGNNIPAISKRTVLISSETANPYHMGYYEKIWQRQQDVMLAHYSPALRDVKAVIETYGIDFFLLDSDVFTPQYVGDDEWRRETQPFANQAVERLEKGEASALERLTPQCTVLEVEGMRILEADCILLATEEDA